MLIFTLYGGGFATIPAYLADVFGSSHVGGIHGRLLTAWSLAGVVGPVVITQLRRSSLNDAITNLAAKVDPGSFYTAFGAPMDQLPTLVAAKTVTIARLLEIAPANVLNPIPHLYDSTMYTCATMLAVASIANYLVKPVHPKHFMSALVTPSGVILPKPAILKKHESL